MSAELSEGFPKIEASLNQLDPETVRRAQLQVCGAAVDVVDANKLLDMLGIHPNQGEPLSRDQRTEQIRTARRTRLREITYKRRYRIPLTDDDEEFLRDKNRIH